MKNNHLNYYKTELVKAEKRLEDLKKLDLNEEFKSKYAKIIIDEIKRYQLKLK